jgi:Zn finger protein HypA/HybF involved in hydrogenase expression
MANSRWHQDLEVAELIQHLNQPEKIENWEGLTPSELRCVLKELNRCRKDFVYAARNYFWITNKKSGDQLFTLWPGQELILQKLLEIKAKGMPQKIMIIKARQLGCSTLIEGLIAWRTMFFSGVNALVVSYDREHTADVLFPIMQFILDRMPWWLQPQVSSRKADTGIFFENPDFKQRAFDPGLNSRIYVKGANSTTGVGQGIRLSAVHASEVCDWDDYTAKEIIDEDMTNALVEDENTFAILESTAKGANRYAHKLWKRCVDLAEQAEWYPLFLPWFFEATRVRPVTVDFHLDAHEVRMRDRVISEWVRCDNPVCMQYHMRYIRSEDREGTICVTCGVGTIRPYILTDPQLSWMHHRRTNAQKDDDSVKKLLQEMATTAEEAFQVTGYQIFGQKAQEFANAEVRPPIAMGDFDQAGRFHGCNTKIPRNASGFHPCYQPTCAANHEWDDNPLLIWEWPKPNANYAVGADIAEGLGGRSCYSVGACIRYSSTGGGDYQVATWRSNTLGPINFGYKLNHLGRMYNDALLSPECNKYDICIGVLRFNTNYPNLYRWKHLDSLQVNSSKLGWYTNVSSRPRLWQTFKSWLQQELFHVRSANLAEEMKNFTKDSEEDIYASGDQDEFDDELMAVMISLYTAHEADYSDSLGIIVPKEEISLENAKFRINCLNCRHSWPQNTVEDKAINPSEFRPELDVNRRVEQSGGMRCPACHSRALQIDRNESLVRQGRSDEDALWAEAASGWSPDRELNDAQLPDYDML